jgi:electron transfer flavoprotein alpha subunit
VNNDIFVFIEQIQGQVAEISYMLLAQARRMVQSNGGQVIAILPGCQVSGIAAGLNADQAWTADHPALENYTWDAYMPLLASAISSHSPRVCLFGETSIGSELASGLSARLSLPLVSYCRRLDVEGGTITAVCQICGGRLMAEGCLPESTTLISMLPGCAKVEEGKSVQPPKMAALASPEISKPRVAMKKFIEPAAVLVAVGRGIQRQDNLELAEELAEELGAVVCVTRPVADQNWLPTSRLVGKSGKTVRPKLYLALGISGAPEHMEGVSEGTQIIAINTDEQAPIFNVARLGAQVDILDLIPALTEKIREIKGA